MKFKILFFYHTSHTQVLDSHTWLVATELDAANLELRGIVTTLENTGCSALEDSADLEGRQENSRQREAGGGKKIHS